MKKIYTLSLYLFGLISFCWAQEPEMVSSQATFVVTGQSVGVIDTILYFPGHNGDFDTELWRSDGTEAGTYEVLDLNPSGRANTKRFVVINDELYFLADSMNVSEQLFKTDGTEEGTEWLADVDDANGETTHMLTASGDRLFYRTYRTGIGTELWTSDGTSAGTQMVINLSQEYSSFPHELTDFNGILIFATETAGTTIGGLNRTDGTAANTIKIGDATPGGIVVVGDTLYFRSTFEDYGPELARATLEPGSIEMVGDLNPGAGGANIFNLTQVDHRIFFRAYHPDYGAELWAYNLNTGEIYLVKDIWPGSSGSSFPDQLISYQGNLIFNAHDGTYGEELWISDGTEEGTKMLKNINVEVGGPPYGNAQPTQFYEAADLLFFSADDGINGRELWQTDGTEAGTKMVYNIGYSYNSSDPGNFTEINGYLFFHAFYNSAYRLYKLKLPQTPVSIPTTLTESQALKIFPNPATTELTVESDFSENLTYRITEVQGKEILNGFSTENKQHQIDISTLKPGLYLLIIEKGTSRRSYKFIKQ